MTNLNPQAQRILDILSDGQKHCPIDWRFSDGHGKRLTDINRYLESFGKTLAWDWCDCRRHTAKIKMRWVVLAHQKPNSAPVAPLPPKHDINPIQPLFRLDSMYE